MSNNNKEMVFQGKITKIMEVVTGTNSNGEWKRIEFLVKEDKPQDEYPQSAKFQMFGAEKVDKFLEYNSVGKLVDVSYNFKTNVTAAGDRYFTNIDAWKVFGANSSSDDTAPSSDAPDDLPF